MSRISRCPQLLRSQPNFKADLRGKPANKKIFEKLTGSPYTHKAKSLRQPKPKPKLSPRPSISKDNSYKEHLFQTFQSVKFCRALPLVPLTTLRRNSISLPKRPGYETKKTLIFDLDETLVHCVGETTSADVVLPLQLPTGAIIAFGVNIRPFVRECLCEANKHFEVIVFTASQKNYADVVLDYLDPSGELIHHRLYREHCSTVAGVYVKDLRVLMHRRLEDIVLVDNMTHSFGYQLDNGIPIVSWTHDSSDSELLSLMSFMQVLEEAQDVRTVLRSTFRLYAFYEDYIQQYLGGNRGGSDNN